MGWHQIFDSKAEADHIIPVNTIRKIEIKGTQYCLANTQAGFKAFHKSCPHLGDDLSKGTLNAIPEVVCPWHSYRFNLTTGDEFRGRCSQLQILKLKWEEGKLLVYVN